jgi:hypothetical protein
VLAGAFDGRDPKPISHGLDEGLLSGAESEGMGDSSGSGLDSQPCELAARNLSSGLMMPVS